MKNGTVIIPFTIKKHKIPKNKLNVRKQKTYTQKTKILMKEIKDDTNR